MAAGAPASAFEQDMQDVAVAIMDATSMMPDMVPNFPSLVHQPPPALFAPPQLLSSETVYMVKAEQSDDLSAPMQSLPDHPSLGYMNVQMESSPMESVEASASLETLVASYEADIAATAASLALAAQADSTMTLELPPAVLSTPSPPLLGPPLTAAIQAPSPPYSVGPSSLEAALIPNALTNPTRLSNSVSPVPLSTANSHSPISIPTPYVSSASQSPTTTSSSQTAILPPAEAEKVVIKDVPIAKQKKEVASLLNALANDFMIASQAVHFLEGTQEELPDEIKSRIASLSRMAAQLSISSNETVPPLLQPPPTPPTSVPVTEHHGGYLLPFETSVHLLHSDQSRKRGPCELDEHRSVKSMKREPQDLPLPVAVEALPLDASAIFPATVAIPSSHAISPISQSRPSSRPPTPSSFAAAVAQYSLIPPQIFSPLAPVPSSLNGNVPAVIPSLPLAAQSFANGRAAWGDGTIVPSRHHHSLSAGAIINPIQVMPSAVVQMPSVPHNPATISGPNTPASVHPPPLVRTVRSGSVSSLTFDANGYFSFPEKLPEAPQMSGNRSARSSTVGTNWYFGDMASSPTNTSEEPATARNSPSDDDDDDSSSEDEDEVNGTTKNMSPLASTEGSSPPGSDIPMEYRGEVDRVFFEYLNKICSNLDAKDSKGDQIHQTLMAKKMQRLDESPDFRPFKFRIQAFTSAFLEELARQGYTEDKIPMKKIRNYLWHQPHILRFNEDGKKAKSKGNHIWNVEAKKLGDGKWEFRPFYRKLAGTPPAVAYAGLRWTWTPRVWDPQASFQNVPIQYSSPNLPSWLSWKDDALSGIPPPDAESCQVTVIAQYIQDGVESKLTRTFPIGIAPMGSGDNGQYPRSRRPSGASEAPRRSASDSALSQAPQRAKGRGVPVPIPNETSSTRVIRVLQNVAQRVTEEAESQRVLPSTIPKTDSLQEIAKQKHVLDQTVEAMDMEMSGHGHIQSKRLAIAAQQVVIQAAANVIADRNVSIGRAPVVPNKSTALQRVSVGELSDATHDAIAAAVKTNGAGSTDVDIIVTAASILKAKAPGADSSPPPAIPPRSIPSMNFASNLSPLPECT